MARPDGAVLARPAGTDGAARRGRSLVPVLVYHAVTDSPGAHIAPFAVTPSAFAAQLDALLEAGYRCLTLSDHLSAVAAHRDGHPGGPASPDDRVAVITVDDGYADFAEHALPLLVERGLPATLYATTGWLRGRGPGEPGPTDRMLDWAQLPELVAAGVEVGAHSHRHAHMDTLSAAAALEELVRSKELLEDALGAPVPSFAYPHGYSSPLVRRLAQRAGYTSAAGVRNALTHAGDDPYRVARLMLRADTPPSTFRGWLEHRGTPVAGSREPWTTRGWRAYRRGRSLLSGTPGTDYR